MRKHFLNFQCVFLICAIIAIKQIIASPSLFNTFLGTLRMLMNGKSCLIPIISTLSVPLQLCNVQTAPSELYESILSPHKIGKFHLWSQRFNPSPWLTLYLRVISLFIMDLLLMDYFSPIFCRIFFPGTTIKYTLKYTIK